jgi:hypothetical protein
MSISTRRKSGVFLIAISVVAMVVFLVVDFFHTDWHYVGSESSDSSHVVAFAGVSRINGYYLIPMFLCGAVGAICLLWPSRKPPKLNQ